MLKTEMRNERSTYIDRMETIDMLRLMNDENRRSVDAVEQALEQVAKAVDVVADALNRGKKLVYIGAGTSGRIAIQDAAECPPTFGVSPETVRAIMAGGKEMVFRAGENAEDGYENGIADTKAVLEPGDVLMGISAAGGAKYVLGSLDYAKSLGCTTIALSNNEGSPILMSCDIPILCDTGAEVITGSTRLKAGNSQKFVLNMISTGAMIKTGKVYENLMVNMNPCNVKLRGRAIRIVEQILHCGEDQAKQLLEENEWNIRQAVESAK